MMQGTSLLLTILCIFHLIELFGSVMEQFIVTDELMSTDKGPIGVTTTNGKK